MTTTFTKERILSKRNKSYLKDQRRPSASTAAASERFNKPYEKPAPARGKQNDNDLPRKNSGIIKKITVYGIAVLLSAGLIASGVGLMF